VKVAFYTPLTAQYLLENCRFTTTMPLIEPLHLRSTATTANNKRAHSEADSVDDNMAKKPRMENVDQAFKDYRAAIAERSKDKAKLQARQAEELAELHARHIEHIEHIDSLLTSQIKACQAWQNHTPSSFSICSIFNTEGPSSTAKTLPYQR
jgi:hypothetical protein